MQWNSLGKNTVPGSLPSSARAQVFQQVAQRPRTFKYGTCDKHGLALKPWIFLSGRNQGRCGALCSEFWSRDERDKPACWTMKNFLMIASMIFQKKPPGALFWLEGSPESRRCCTLTCVYVTLAKRKGCPLTQVKHCRMQFCRRLNKVLRGQAVRTGTHMDRVWGHLKSYVPNSLHAKTSKGINPLLMQYTWSYQFRRNCGKSLWKKMGQQCRRF